MTFQENWGQLQAFFFSVLPWLHPGHALRVGAASRLFGLVPSCTLLLGGLKTGNRLGIADQDQVNHLTTAPYPFPVFSLWSEV